MEKGSLLFTVKQCSELDIAMLEQESKHDKSRQIPLEWRVMLRLNPEPSYRGLRISETSVSIAVIELCTLCMVF